jgi:glycosyltransferase involved in cell wall biosynthesis
MACIIKIPSENSKGVVTFTTPERDKFIMFNSSLQARINRLKDRWAVGLHHNWHDFNFSYNSLFDFSMAGEGDLIEKNGKQIPLISMDACNFSPEVFHFSNNEKFWDIFYVARAVSFKRIPEFFRIIRNLFDSGKKYRVLLISPVPDECKSNPKSETAFCAIRKMYDAMFTQEEQNLFTLLTTDYRYPFPFDIPTLAHFYKHSRVFVHTAEDERRCRVAGYAWACGMPVVGMAPIVSLMPASLQKPPYSYVPKSYDEFAKLIEEAVEFTKSDLYNEQTMRPAIKEVAARYTRQTLIEKLSPYCGGIGSAQEYALENLDIRLGRHHGLGDHTNSIGWSIDSLLNYLEKALDEQLAEDIKQTDPERYITKYTQYGKVHKESQFQSKIKQSLRGILIHLYDKHLFQKLRRCIVGK